MHYIYLNNNIGWGEKTFISFEDVSFNSFKSELYINYIKISNSKSVSFTNFGKFNQLPDLTQRYWNVPEQSVIFASAKLLLCSSLEQAPVVVETQTSPEADAYLA